MLGGKFRDKVRLYDHSSPRDFLDKAVVKDWAAKVKAMPNGIQQHKFAPLRNRPGEDPGREQYDTTDNSGERTVERAEIAAVRNEEAQAAYDPHDGTGQFFVYASGDPARADEIWSIVEREIAALHETLCDDDLLRLRAKHATSVTLGAERPGDRMQRLGRLWAALGKYESLEDELAKINAVTLDDLRATLEAFPFSPRTVGRLMPAQAGASS